MSSSQCLTVCGMRIDFNTVMIPVTGIVKGNLKFQNCKGSEIKYPGLILLIISEGALPEVSRIHEEGDQISLMKPRRPSFTEAYLKLLMFRKNIFFEKSKKLRTRNTRSFTLCHQYSKGFVKQSPQFME